MFARYSGNRSNMKGSGVVQGLKSLVHSQLPLTAKESQRLLTALTSSFRRHLDEVYPPRNIEDDKRKATSSTHVSPTNVHRIHSSASYAEEHLASVLTNPLFSSGQVLDYKTAQDALAQHPEKDPIDLLEEYHQKGAASISIACLCMKTVLGGISSMSDEERNSRIRQLKPGTRVLLWLLKSGLNKASASVDNVDFISMLVQNLMLEGQEQNLWLWLQLDVVMEHDTVISPISEVVMMHRYRWRGRLLRAMIHSKLGLPLERSEKENYRRKYTATAQQVHDALDVYIRAYELKRSAPHGHHLCWIPYGTAAVELNKHLSVPNLNPRRDLDPQRYEKFIESLLALRARQPMTRDRSVARAYLLHPTQPSADKAYQFMRALYKTPPIDVHAVQGLRHDIDRSPASRLNWHHVMARTVYLLRNNGDHQKAEWVKAMAREHIPEFSHFFEKEIAKMARFDAAGQPIATVVEEQTGDMPLQVIT